MANIPISQINTTSDSLNRDDYLLISKKNNDGTFTSAKILGSNLGGLGNTNFSNQNVVVYLSPDGNDNNIENQFLYRGKSTQSNYSLYSLNAAITYIHKFRAGSRMNFIINMAEGTYEYNIHQVLAHPDTTCNFFIRGTNNNTIIKPNTTWDDTNSSYHSLLLFTRGYWNIENITFDASSWTTTKFSNALNTSVNSDVTIKNCTFLNFQNAIGINDSSWGKVSSCSFNNNTISIDLQRISSVQLEGINNMTGVDSKTELGQIRIAGNSQVLFGSNSNLTINSPASTGIHISAQSSCVCGSSSTINITAKIPFRSKRYDEDTSTVIVNTSDNISDHVYVFDTEPTAGNTWNLTTVTD